MKERGSRDEGKKGEGRVGEDGRRKEGIGSETRRGKRRGEGGGKEGKKKERVWIMRRKREIGWEKREEWL